MTGDAPSSRWKRICRAFAAALRSGAGPVMTCPTTPLVAPPAITGLHVCRRCDGDHVVLVRSQPAGEGRWAMLLRCADCAAWRRTIVTYEQAAEFDAVLDRQRAAIAEELERLNAARMGQEIEIIVRALAEDLIDAADFARRVPGQEEP